MDPSSGWTVEEGPDYLTARLDGYIVGAWLTDGQGQWRASFKPRVPMPLAVLDTLAETLRG